MAGSPRAIKQRIRGIKNISQITKAMEMVAAVRFARMQALTQNARPYVEKLQEAMRHVRQSLSSGEHPLFASREVRKTWAVLVTGDRGLCGTYNSNIIVEAERLAQDRPAQQLEWIVIGKKGYEALRRKDLAIQRYSLMGPGEVPAGEMRSLVQSLIGAYASGEVDEVVVLFTRFVNVLTHRPTERRLLPFESAAETAGETALDFIFEPSAEEIIVFLAPLFIESQIAQAVVESFTSEQAARMVTMRNATDNAEEIIKDLTLRFNKARQASITKELIDIVSGAEALRAK